MRSMLIVAALLLAACKGETEHGECVGFGKEDPALKYELSTRNAVVTAVFAGGIVVPVVWALEYAYCPTGRMTANKDKE